MLTCHACMKHCLQTIIGHSIVVSSRPRASVVAAIHRSYNTSSGSTNFQPVSSERPGSLRDGYEGRKPLLSREEERQRWFKSRGVTPDHKKRDRAKRPAADQDFVIRKHLSYLKDPLKLADFVRATLRSNDFETALEVTRAASKSMQCTVSWNHLVDYQLEQKKINAAIKTYNEMKKRAQTPDARTYTIIFRGCAAHPDSEQALERCLALYQSMSSEKSPVKPNIIHMNALLKMCARANNIEAMFAIAETLDSKGVHAQPNNLTFTTIFNGLRMSLILDSRSDLTPMQKRQNTRKALWEARKLWARATKLWRKGEIWIDEELVASMGRILLAGEEQDVDDIFSLIEQAMQIPRQIPPLVRKAGDQELSSQYRRLPSDESASAHATVQSQAANEEAELLPDLFVPSEVATKNSSRGFAKPGQNTLSILMQACLKLKSKDAATKYWEIFTENGVKPDAENYHAYLRLLRFFRSSTETVQVVLHMKQQDLQHKTFRIAMSTCERDKLNPHVFSNAGKLLDMLQMSQVKDSIIPVLISYLEVAMAAPVYSKMNKQNEYTPIGHGKQILRALERLEPFITQLRNNIFITDPDMARREGILPDFTLLVRRMISACDQLIHNGLATKDIVTMMKGYRARLAAMLHRRKFTKSDFGKATPLVPTDWASEIEDTAEEPQDLSVGEDSLTGRFSPVTGHRSREPLKRESPTWGRNSNIPDAPKPVSIQRN